MKVTVENKKGLNKDLKVFIDKKTINSYLEKKYEEVKKNVVLKGFRPGKVPKEILKKQFGQAIMGEVLDKILKETSSKAMQENKIKPAVQPKIDLKSFGEDKDLEYVINVTELPKVELKSIDKIKYDEFTIKLEQQETNKRIEQIAKSQNNFETTEKGYKAKKGDLVVFDYEAEVDNNQFKGNQGKNTQLILGKDLFIKGFDDQLVGSKKDEEKKVEAILPENFPEKSVANKKAIFICKIIDVKVSKEVNINDEFAKSLGAKDLNDLKTIISKQINDEYKNSLDVISKKQILDQIEKFKIEELPKVLIDEEVKILTQGMKEEEVKKNIKKFEEQAKKRIKTGIILNEFGEKNQIKVTEQDLQNEINKQLRMMPGQENIVKEYYEKNPSALAGLRGSVYEEKILHLIKSKAKANKKELSKIQAENILKEENKRQLSQDIENEENNKEVVKTKTTKKQQIPKKIKTISKKTKKVSKK